ncbi:hypothetical protein V6N12_047868 [Hibiscus sabdariffa]|uniref:RNase H type-1 domain-containing protein n=1 Tax=Hibiscus sabdariffa TaxID=183260 RepID=A0ABR2CU87_9ROSI
MRCRHPQAMPREAIRTRTRNLPSKMEAPPQKPRSCRCRKCLKGRVCLDTFSLPIGPGPPVMAELEAIFHGLSIFFSNHGFKKFRLILETDCSVAFEWISNSTPCPTVFEPLVRRCRDIIASFSVVFRHIPREINLAVDSLAKEGIG